MTRHIAEFGHFKKRNLTCEELKELQKPYDKNYELDLKRKVQEIFHNGGIDISLDEIFQE